MRNANFYKKLFTNAIVYCTLLVMFLLNYSEAFGQLGDVVIPPVHDPTMIKQDSVYYVYCTGWGIPIRSSTDLVHWKFIGQVFSKPQEWGVRTLKEFKGRYVSPDISYHNGTYYLFYCITSYGKNTSAIGVATNTTLHPDDPNYKWVDHGKVLESVPNRDNWNAVDPTVVQDEDGSYWLSFGSFWSGVKIVKLAPDLLRIQTEPQVWYPLARRPRLPGTPDWHSGEAAVEAPFIMRKNDYYYLFVSQDYCCKGVNSNYKIKVGRSKKLLGPYIDRDGTPLMEGGGTLLLAGDKRWPGRGSNSVYSENGVDWLVYHAYDARINGARTLRIRKLLWDEEGWPVAGDVVSAQYEGAAEGN